MTSLALLLALSAPAADAPAKPVPAKITITAEVVCLHCSFGIEDYDGCGACLKLDDKTPVILAGKAADDLFKARFGKKVFVAEGTLAVDKHKRMVLTLTAARERTDADKDKVPDAGQTQVDGTVQAKDGKLSILNGDAPVNVESAQKAKPDNNTPVTATGKLTVKDGGVRLEATSVTPVEKK